MKKILKCLSILLSVVMLLGGFSVANPVIATDLQEAEKTLETLNELKNNLEEKDVTVTEIVSQRDRFTKVFANSDGTKTAIVSSTPIHYKQGNKWIDIDNTLVEVNGVYKNEDNSFTASIPEELSKESEIKIEKNGYSVSFKLKGTDIFKTKTKSKSKKVNKKSSKQSLENGLGTDFLNKNSGVKFDDVGSDTAVEYTVTPTGIKENIILREKLNENVIYEYDIKAKNLTAEKNSDNSISFKNAEKEEIFVIPAPVMYDKNGDTSYDINVSLTGSDKKFVMTYKPSAKWLSSAEYPVVIDPVINTNVSEPGVIDTYVSSLYPTQNSENNSIMYLGYTSTTENIAYFNLSYGYLFNSGVKIKSVLLGVYKTETNIIDGSIEIGAYPITESWSAIDVTYNTKPSLGAMLDKTTITSSTTTGYSLFDVTSAYSAVATVPYGIALKRTDTSTGKATATLVASENTTYADHHPYFVIEYYESQGVEEQFDYHIIDAGRAGMVYFNDFTNQIYIERDELGLSGLKMPVQIKRYYNSVLGGTYSDEYSFLYDVYAPYGAGWRTNYSQSIEYGGVIDGKEHILYCNPEGKTTYFAKTDTVTDGKTKWEEMPDKFSDGSGYTLWLASAYDASVSANLQYATIEDSKGQVYEFNSNGYLIKINSADKDSTECITIAYLSNGYAINKITDGAGRYYKFNYSDTLCGVPLLTSIKAYSKSNVAITTKANTNYEITYTYSLATIQGNEMPILSSATYPDGEAVNYSVSNSLTTVQNIDGYTFSVEQRTAGWYELSEMVQKDDTTVKGGSLRVMTPNGRLYERTLRDGNGDIQTKQYDLYGRVINVQNDDGTLAPRSYSDNLVSNGRLTYGLYNDYEYGDAVEGEELVLNGSFNSNLSYWDASNSSYVSRSSANDSNSENSTPGSIQLTGNKNTFVYAQQIIEVDDGVSGDEYCLEFFVKNSGSHNNVDMLYWSMIVIQARKNIDGSGEWENVGYVDINPFNAYWQKYRYNFELDTDYNEISLNLAYYFQDGKVWYDDISLKNIYKATASVSNGGSASSGEEISKCTCSYCESNCSCEHTGTTACTPETCPDCGECTCEGCTQFNCPCRDCSENCTLSACKRGYDFGSDSTGSWFEITDGEKEMSMTQTVEGNYYGSQTDINGIYTGYSYNQSNGQLMSVSANDDTVTSFTYDAMSRLNSVSKTVNGLSSGNKMTTQYTYENDRIKSITHNGFSYNYEYDVWGNVTAIKISDQSIVGYTYGEKENRSQLNRITYSNGDYTDYTYSDEGNVTAIKSYSSENTLTSDYEYVYGEYGQVTKIKNNIENSEVRYEDNKTSIVLLNTEGATDDVVLYSTETNDEGEIVEVLGGKEYTVRENLSVNDPETGVTTSSTVVEVGDFTETFKSQTDFFGRTISNGVAEESQLETDNEALVITSDQKGVWYEYKNYGTNAAKTTSLVSKYKHGTKYNVEITDDTLREEFIAELPDGADYRNFFIGTEYSYEYDSNGNIVRVLFSNIEGYEATATSVLFSYVYDEAGQLVRENNFDLGKTYVYVYDKGGNIAQKIEYTATEDTLGEPLSTVNYTYDSIWKDKLTSYGNTAITTDAMGNPLNSISHDINGDEVNGALEWNGRQLSAVEFNGERCEYYYDSNGMRTTVKKYGNDNNLDQIYRYFWENNKLIGYMITDSNGNIDIIIKMLYDDTGETIGYHYTNLDQDITLPLYFVKNLQGDIIKVTDEAGEELVTYHYDAWGNVTPTPAGDNLEEAVIAVLAIAFTPITYRGYMYDPFTGLYYLQSRYYNPTYGRFLNSDSTEILNETAGTIHGTNLFAYCNNNPIMNVDYSGKNPLAILGGVAAVLGTIFTYIVLIITFLIIVFSISTITIEGVTDSQYYNRGAFLQSLRKILEYIERGKLLLLGTLYASALNACNKGFNSNYVKHHIIAKNSVKASIARFFFIDVGGNVNQEENLVEIHEVFHWFLHTNIYYAAIDLLISESYYFHGAYSRKTSVYSMLSAIKTTIEYINAAAPWW